MLIINADDLGRNRLATDRILECHRVGSVTSASGMVFMEDSERAAALANEAGLDVGCHLNFTEPLTHPSVPPRLAECHDRIRRFLSLSRYASLIYHPLLVRAFRYCFESQRDEFIRLHGRAPSHYDGHHHMHLAANVVFQKLLPAGSRVRRNFSFQKGEKSPFNRLYRSLIDRLLLRRHVCPDFLFPLQKLQDPARSRAIHDLATRWVVEVETHPELDGEYCFLTGKDFINAIQMVPTGTYANIRG